MIVFFMFVVAKKPTPVELRTLLALTLCLIRDFYLFLKIGKYVSRWLYPKMQVFDRIDLDIFRREQLHNLLIIFQIGCFLQLPLLVVLLQAIEEELALFLLQAVLEELVQGLQLLVILDVEKLGDSDFQPFVIKQMFQLDCLQIDDLLGIHLAVQELLVLQGHFLQLSLQMQAFLLDIVIIPLQLFYLLLVQLQSLRDLLMLLLKDTHPLQKGCLLVIQSLHLLLMLGVDASDLLTVRFLDIGDDVVMICYHIFRLSKLVQLLLGFGYFLPEVFNDADQSFQTRHHFLKSRSKCLFFRTDLRITIKKFLSLTDVLCQPLHPLLKFGPQLPHNQLGIFFLLALLHGLPALEDVPHVYYDSYLQQWEQ